MSVLYPVAPTAEEALSKPLGRAAREREARTVVEAHRPEAGTDTLFFAVEEVGPAYDTREAALEAWKGLVDDARQSVAPEDRYCTVREILAPVKGKTPRVAPVKPAFKDGRRWPAPAKAATAARTQWRLSVSYWRIGPQPSTSALPPARKMRRDQSARDLGHDALEALTRQPLTATAPQRPLDIGLFETRAPENPDLVLPDE
ncbi:MAG TPA: hypothetical protein VG407_13895 [Caulobacteraceae bacterium]|jgi:hypothetical protein|nr:hypothetical protein [Caulobacteraceae bacterium]